MKGYIFTLALTYGGAVVSLFWPFYGLLVYFCFAIVKPEAMWYWVIVPGNYSRIVAIALLVGWAASGFGRWVFGRAALTVYSLLGFLGWNIVSTSMTSDTVLSWFLIEQRFKIILPFIVGITLVTTVRQLKQITWVLVVSLAYVAYELNLSYVQGYNRLAMNGFGGMDNNTVSIAMVCGAGLAFFLGINQTIWWRRWLAFACAAAMAHVPMFGDSRGGMLGLAVTGVVAFMLIPKQPRHYFAFALAVIVAWFVMAGPGVRERFSTVFASSEKRDASESSRIVLWRQCRQFMFAEPLFGIGPGQFPSRVAPLWEGFPKEGHSLWLQTGAELGFPGFIFLLGFYASIIWRLWSLIRSRAPIDPWLLGAARMVIASLVGFMVAASFVSVTGIEPPYYVALIGAGVLKLAGQQEPKSGSTAPGREIPAEPDYAMAQ